MWLVFAIGSAAFFTGYDLLSRVLSLKTENPVVYSGIYNITVACLALLLFMIEPFGITTEPLRPSTIILFLIGMSVWSLFARFEFRARKLNEVSRMKIITRLSRVVTFILAALFLGEDITSAKIVALVLMFVANYLVIRGGNSSKPREKKQGPGSSLDSDSKKAVLMALAVAVTAGTGYFFDKVLSDRFTLPFYTSAAYLIPGLVVLSVPPVGTRAVKRELKKNSITWTIVLASMAMLAFYLYLKALALQDVSSVVVVSSMSSVLAVVLGIAVLKEREDIPQKLLAGALVLIAILIL